MLLLSWQADRLAREQELSFSKQYQSNPHFPLLGRSWTPARTPNVFGLDTPPEFWPRGMGVLGEQVARYHCVGGVLAKFSVDMQHGQHLLCSAASRESTQKPQTVRCGSWATFVAGAVRLTSKLTVRLKPIPSPGGPVAHMRTLHLFDGSKHPGSYRNLVQRPGVGIHVTTPSYSQPFNGRSGSRDSRNAAKRFMLPTMHGRSLMPLSVQLGSPCVPISCSSNGDIRHARLAHCPSRADGFSGDACFAFLVNVFARSDIWRYKRRRKYFLNR
jgi:hypothetical protein